MTITSPRIRKFLNPLILSCSPIRGSHAGSGGDLH
jgi:hypothetical protein